MLGMPAFSTYSDHGADAFDTPQRLGRPTATTGDPLSALADWKGERSRRVPGDASTGVIIGNEERGSKDATRLSSLREIEDFPLAVRTRCVLTTSRESEALSNDSEPRAHESARASEVLSGCESTSGRDQFAAHQPTSNQ